MTTNKSIIKNRSLSGLIFQHIKSLLAINFSSKNLKWLATLLVFIHLGFLGAHDFLNKRFSSGLTTLLSFCLGIGLFYVPVTGFWIYITQGVALLALLFWAFLYLMHLATIVIGGYGYLGDDVEEDDDYKFGIFVHIIILAMLIVYIEYIVLHFQEIPYLPQIIEPALQPFIKGISFVKNLF